jgi:type VI protein secretion system component VasF
MSIALVMWSVWIVLAVIFAALYLYRSRLTRDEEDQLFLDESFSQEKNAQEAIVAKVNKVQPLIQVATWLLGAATLFVVGYYVVDIYNKLR